MRSRQGGQLDTKQQELEQMGNGTIRLSDVSHSSACDCEKNERVRATQPTLPGGSVPQPHGQN